MAGARASLGPGSAPFDDGALLAALRQGQAGAFERLMRRYNRLLFRAARGVVHDDAEAQDVVQEAWIRAFTGLRDFRGEASLATWLTRIAVHQALTQQRRLGRLVFWDEDPGEGDMQDNAPGTERAPSPEQEVERIELRRRLEGAIDLLPPMYRTVFMLRAVEGLSVEDTALGLQVSPEVVRTRFLRARALLRSHLGSDPEAEAGRLHDFAGRRCDEMVARVLARLRECGLIRDH